MEPTSIPFAHRPLAQGYGSNLTFQGTVECDAAIMDGRTGDFGSVGAVEGTSFLHLPRTTIL
ncbi:hypothetical protein J3R82DRAFT_10353 [Butyriboletus roseoflavus]|nr:hypothetical protein J3R82DRAFT_10353 [Butyriboletus roseoflavus]